MSKRFIIIDGYNLLHVNGFSGRNVGPGTLEKARNLLLGILARKLDSMTRQRTTVVFDSSESNLPNRATAHEMLIEFANGYNSADEMITVLIGKHSAPRQLTVVSSDHQIQRVALARGATAIDSDQWLDDVIAKSADSPSAGKDVLPEKPAGERGQIDIEYWKKELAVDDLEIAVRNQAEPKPADNPLSANQTSTPNPADDTFPPGYADDLFDDE